MNWAVAWTQPRSERRAQFHAERQGFVCWNPRTLDDDGRECQLFPRYMLVKIESAWRSLLGTIGIVTVVRCGDEPSWVPPSVINELKARERNGLILLDRPDKFQVGDTVRVEAGVFEHMTGIFDGRRGADRVCVLLNVIGKQVRVDMPETAIGLV